jgi:hypothetical protein
MFLRRFLFVLLISIFASCAGQRPTVVYLPPPIPAPLPLPAALAPVADLQSLRPGADRVGQLRTQMDQLRVRISPSPLFFLLQIVQLSEFKFQNLQFANRKVDVASQEGVRTLLLLLQQTIC